MLLYHVTFNDKLQKILDDGIIPGKKQTWEKALGKFKKGFIRIRKPRHLWRG